MVDDAQVIDRYVPREFTVRIRRDFPRAVRPEAEQLDGKTFRFTYGWPMDKIDPYPGEIAYIPCRGQGWPEGAPPWIASGDLHEP